MAGELDCRKKIQVMRREETDGAGSENNHLKWEG